MDGEDDMIPTKDMGYMGDLGQESEAMLMQQRSMVSKIDRDELEDRSGFLKLQFSTYSIVL